MGEQALDFFLGVRDPLGVSEPLGQAEGFSERLFIGEKPSLYRLNSDDHLDRQVVLMLRKTGLNGGPGVYWVSPVRVAEHEGRINEATLAQLAQNADTLADYWAAASPHRELYSLANLRDECSDNRLIVFALDHRP